MNHRTPFCAWRLTMMGVVLHAVRTDGTNRAVGPSLCGRESRDGIWHYAKGRSIGISQWRCSRCAQAARRSEAVS